MNWLAYLILWWMLNWPRALYTVFVLAVAIFLARWLCYIVGI